MKSMHVSAGVRIILCSRPDCAHAGDRVPEASITALTEMSSSVVYSYCLAEVLVMDRRVKFGLPCARFGLRANPKVPT